MNGGTEPQTEDGAMIAVARTEPFRQATRTPTMRRRAILASAGAMLAGCLGSPAAADESGDGAGVSTSTGTGTPVAPLVNWAFSLDPDRDAATVTHDTGEPITAERTSRVELVLTTAPDHPIPTDATLTPTPTPRVVRTGWSEAGGDYPITAGDRVTVEATPGDTLAVWWYGDKHHRDGTRLESATFAKV